MTRMTADIRAGDLMTTDPIVVESDSPAIHADRQLNALRIGPTASAAGLSIPASHLDLVECPPVAALTTVMSNGYPQTSVVWCDFDGRHVRVNTMAGFAKERNMRRNPAVTVLCYDPHQPLRYLEIRGTVVEMTEQGPRGTLTLSPRSTSAALPLLRGRDPDLLRGDRDPVLCLIRPDHVVALDARAGGSM